MDMIYSNSFVTIAADWGSDSNNGCFNQVSHKLSEDEEGLIMISGILSDGLKSTLYLGRTCKADLREIQTSAVTTRAWAYQERLLYSRILHFTESQILWECKQELLAEDGIPRLCGQIYPYPGIIGVHLQTRFKHKGVNAALILWYIFFIARNY
jgi:hypothetical protein